MYLTVIERIVAEGKTCIMLVPEIALTPNMLKQLRNRFGDKVALLHSGLSIGERYDEWLRLKTKKRNSDRGAQRHFRASFKRGRHHNRRRTRFELHIGF